MSSSRWAKRNPEKANEVVRLWRLKNPELVALQRKRAYAKNKDKMRERRKEWTLKNKERSKGQYCNAGARKQGDFKPIPSAELAERMKLANGLCEYCGKSCKMLSFEHKVPLSRGGSHSLRNIAISCFSCNSRKRNRNVSEFKSYCLKKGVPLII